MAERVSAVPAVLFILIGLGWLRCEYLARSINDKLAKVTRADRLIVEYLELSDEEIEASDEREQAEQHVSRGFSLRRLARIILLRYRKRRHYRKLKTRETRDDEFESDSLPDAFDVLSEG